MVGDLLAGVGDTAQARDGFDRLAIARSNGGSAGDCGVDVLQLQQAEGSLHLVHLAVDTNGDDVGFAIKAEVFQIVDVALGLGIRADDGTALKGVEDLGRMEAEHREITVVEHAAAVTLDTEGVGSVVDDLEVVAVCDALDGLDIAGVAIAVHRQDGDALRSDGCFDLGRVEIEGARLNVDEDRGDVVPEQRVRSGDEGVRGRDDLAGDAQGLERGDQREGAIGEECQVLDAEVVTQGLFELLVKRAVVGEKLAVPDLLQEGDEVLQRGQMRLGDVEGVRHYCSPGQGLKTFVFVSVIMRCHINAQKSAQFLPFIRILKVACKKSASFMSLKKFFHFSVVKPINIFVMLPHIHQLHNLASAQRVFRSFINQSSIQEIIILVLAPVHLAVTKGSAYYIAMRMSAH